MAQTTSGATSGFNAGELDIIASKTSSKNDFDFLVGEWNIRSRKLKSRLTNSNEWIEFDATHEMHKVLAGIGNTDVMKAAIDGKPYEGMSIRLFNPQTRLWSIYWADSNNGTMEKAVVGSFENKLGKFFSREMYQGREIILQFNWDVSNPDKPVWSQAFSIDNGKTWEWNWYMYFTRRNAASLNANQEIKVIELRNYLIRPGQRDQFIDYFETNLTQSQNELGGFTLGQYRVKGADDNFFWIRGFKDMASRSKFLPGFYQGPFWKQHRTAANAMLLNNDNVHLLKPLTGTINSNEFGKKNGIAVVDYYISNQKRDKLIEFFKNKHTTILQTSGISNTSFWISETTPNDFEALPAFQDKNLLVTITWYADELEYQSKMKAVDKNMSEELKNELMDLVTTKNTMILYPTKKSFSIGH